MFILDAPQVSARTLDQAPHQTPGDRPRKPAERTDSDKIRPAAPDGVGGLQPVDFRTPVLLFFLGERGQSGERSFEAGIPFSLQGRQELMPDAVPGQDRILIGRVRAHGDKRAPPDG